MARGKYHEWLQEDNLILLRAWARNGLTDEEIAKNIGISRSTLSEWKNKYPDISDAIKKPKKVYDYEAEETLHKASLGYYVEEAKTYIDIKNGVENKRIEKTKKWIKPEIGALIFWLKNRDPDNWKDRKAVEEVSNQDDALEKYFRMLTDKVVSDE